MKNPKVSVVIPVYNEEKTLPECLSSVLKQNYENYEVIVVDNNSTDATKKMIKQWQKKSKKIRYLFERKMGRGAARYSGGVNAKGEIILMTDADCLVPKNWIKEMIEPIINHKQVTVQGSKKPIIQNYWTKHIMKERQKFANSKDRISGRLDTANLAIKKSVLKEVGYTNRDLVYCEDLELSIKLKITNYILYFKNIAVFHHFPSTPLELSKKTFRYGEWNSRIRNLYRDKKEVFPIEPPMSHLRYLLGIASNLVFLHKDLKYNLVTGLSWRAGRLYGWLKK
jgi:glycosyltransferase involved in cell wall biosynthesis